MLTPSLISTVVRATVGNAGRKRCRRPGWLVCQNETHSITCDKCGIILHKRTTKQPKLDSELFWMDKWGKHNFWTIRRKRQLKHDHFGICALCTIDRLIPRFRSTIEPTSSITFSPTHCTGSFAKTFSTQNRTLDSYNLTFLRSVDNWKSNCNALQLPIHTGSRWIMFEQTISINNRGTQNENDQLPPDAAELASSVCACVCVCVVWNNQQ